MRATGVLVRFLSLLDVALILLGVLMIALMHSQVRKPANRSAAADGSPAALADVNFVYLYAGWKGEEAGKFFALGQRGEIGREVRTTTPDDIRQLLAAAPGGRERKNHVVMLLFDEDGWHTAWKQEQLAAVETTWGVKVVPVYNVKLPR